MLVKILNVDVEHIVKGKNKYSVATVAYMFNGEARTQKVVSFANPDVYKQVANFVGKEVDVTLTKNDAGYSQWSAISEAGAVPPVSQTPSGVAASAPTAVRVTGSNYETPAERAQKQVYIIKQSSLSAAIALASNNKEKATTADIIATAQKFVDYVLDVKPVDNSIEGMSNDIPY